MKKTIIQAALVTVGLWCAWSAFCDYQHVVIDPQKSRDAATAAWDRSQKLIAVGSCAAAAEQARASAAKKSSTPADGVDYKRALDELDTAKREALDAGVAEWRITSAEEAETKRAKAEIEQ